MNDLPPRPHNRMKLLFLTVFPIFALHAAPVALFDGKSLEGWEVRKGEEKWWRVQDGALTGGSLEEKVPHNTFLTTTGSYENFDLSFKVRLVKGSGFQNSGLQVRSVRKERSHEMIGYQVDAGIGYWGDIYDESRRNKAIAKPIDPTALAKVVQDWDWNDCRILCEGPRIRTWINGVLAHDYTETDLTIPRDGLLGLQAHGGGKFLVQMKEVMIEKLPPSPGAPLWNKPRGDGARSPEEQRVGFTLPEGFSVELVASEEQGVGKPITIAWDRHGRMWTMTALEYPVDANENAAAAASLFARGGRDQVLVFDEPNTDGPLSPRVFAEGLAIPLGMLPLPDGVLVQHGPEIRRYIDSDADGKADSHEVVLEGFGIQDSHLFPHQFERAPGGWVYLAQGAFNSSTVRRPGGAPFADGSDSVIFNNCKLGRFKPDGSSFQALTGGPNNIWGLVISRSGETFVQEANDLGYPVAEFAPGTHYPTGFGPKMRSDAPVLPRSTPGSVMGGTGLSGLALAEDRDTPFARRFGGAQVFYVVNPITSRIQIVTLTRDAKGFPTYQKQEDFMLSADPWFRPIAAHFGPDGCLYIVDWYNKIISHNEVPRTHPDRDKSRGRIWRVRHASQQARPRVDVAALSEDELLEGLGGPNARIASQVWQEISDRKAIGLVPRLTAVVRDSSQALARRTAALWALEGLGPLAPEILLVLAQEAEHTLRHEALRIAGEQSLAEKDSLGLFSHLENESHFRVRAALANALRDHRKPSSAMMEFAAKLGREPLAGDSREAYDRSFERYLARWAMATHPEATRAMLASAELPVEARLLAVRSFADTEAALGMLELLPEISRPLIPDELALLGGQLGQPAVQDGFSKLLDNPQRRGAMLKAMLRLDPGVASDPMLGEIVGAAAVALLESNRNAGNERLVVQLARRFRIAALSSEVSNWLQDPSRSTAELVEGLAALRESGAATLPTFRPYLDHAEETVRREALIGFASIDDVAVVAELASRWNALTGAARSLAIDGMVSGAAKAEALARSLGDGELGGFDGAAVEKVVAALGPEHPAVTTLLTQSGGLLRPVIQLTGAASGRVKTNIHLEGPFTLEGWIRLEKKIDNHDSLLGGRSGSDFNFHDGKLRLHAAKQDQIIATRPIPPGEWTHCAITRDAAGNLALFLEGEPDAKGGNFTGKLAGLNLGESLAAGGSEASYDEFRIWNVARSAEEIRRDHRTRFTAADRPPGLIHWIHAASPGGALEGGAKISLSRDFPELLTPAEASALHARFERFRKLTALPGDPAAGKQLAQASCLICHQVSGEGVAIGPDLSGAGAMGQEALLRNILTPNEQLESGYYRHDLKLKNGTVLSGFLSAVTADSVTLRQIGADERSIPRSQILKHEISRRSLMPEGLIDGFTDKQVADLFSYLMSLK
jgi:putative membrane-bound dehydrogenase-like protein